VVVLDYQKQYMNDFEKFRDSHHLSADFRSVFTQNVVVDLKEKEAIGHNPKSSSFRF